MTLFLFFLASISVPIAVLFIFLYLQASFRLLEMVEARHPELWQSLGEPKRVFVRQQAGGIHTIQPLMPWLSWVWAGNPRGLDAHAVVQYRLTRSRLLLGGAALVTSFLMIGLLIITAPAA